MKLFKRKKKEVVKPTIYYDSDLIEFDDWENYYGNYYGERWL